jgi:hypothetical protein
MPSFTGFPISDQVSVKVSVETIPERQSVRRSLLSSLSQRDTEMKRLIHYLYKIKLDKAILWCYLIWYIVVVCFHFDASLKIWINSIGISVVIGTGLILSVSSNKTDERDDWQIFRLFLMPFCVSSFSALIKDQGFIVFISPNILETGVAIFSCALFLLVTFVIKSFKTTMV